ncbi:MAG TPA: efflux RND transporter periplasmic adaptor subunit [Patescibacteria group bacterium]|nr:efflux RND transporter periplasmic adaptor subunit [Patescibacteria group bacterium]
MNTHIESLRHSRRNWKLGPAARPSRIALCLAVAALVAGAGCGREENHSENQMTSFSSQGVQAAYFSVPQNQLPRIQIVPAATEKMERVLRLPGTVGYNVFRTTPVITPVGGPVTRVLVVPGEVVKQGQPLLYVTSPDYSQLRANFLKTRDAYQLSETNDKRAQDLYAHKAIAESAMLQAQSARNEALADFQAAQQSLEALGITNPAQAAGNPSAQFPVLAPIGGEVVERLVAPGQLIQAGTTQCFTISDMNTVWVLVNVYQKDLSDVRVGEPATIETSSYPEPFHGRISYLAPALDPNTRTLAARVVTANRGLALKKDMYVTVLLDAGTIPNALAVPQDAVLRDAENHPFVYVQVAHDQFARRLVETGQTQGNSIQITTGLRAGEKVVGNGSLFLQFANSLR